MDFQTAFNVLLGGFSFLAGFLIHATWRSVGDLRRADTELTKKVHSIETLVVGDYLTRDEMHKFSSLYF